MQRIFLIDQVFLDVCERKVARENQSAEVCNEAPRKLGFSRLCPFVSHVHRV